MTVQSTTHPVLSELTEKVRKRTQAELNREDRRKELTIARLINGDVIGAKRALRIACSELRLRNREARRAANDAHNYIFSSDRGSDEQKSRYLAVCKSILAGRDAALKEAGIEVPASSQSFQAVNSL